MSVAATTGPKIIEIHADGTVSPDTVVIDINSDGVEWTGPAGLNWNVKFDRKTPFAKSDFNNNDPKSGKPVKDGPQQQAAKQYQVDLAYKYSVKVGSGPWVDPNIIVRET